jgi:hypothetical protein
MLSLIFLIIFPFAAWKAWKNIQMAKASTAWPATTGKIVAAESAKVMFRRQPRVTYSYSVNGAPYTSQRISFAGGYRPKETDAILGRYPVGSEIPVAYAPDKPAEATLETGANKQVMAQLRVLVIFFVLIIAMNILNYYLKSLNKETRQPIRTYGLVERPLPSSLNPVNPV